MSPTLFSDVFLPVTLAVIMLGLGFSIRLEEIRNIITEKKNIIIGLISQLVLLPLIAFAIAIITNLDPLFAVGLVLIAVCPGGATSNLVNYMINGNVALSVTITVVNGFITVYTIPLLTVMALNYFVGQDMDIQLSLGKTVVNIFALTVLPVTAGILIKAWRPDFTKKLETPLRYILPAMLFLVYAGVLILEKGGNSPEPSSFFKVLPYALALNLLSILAGFFFPALFKIEKRNRFTIAVEVGLQNSTLALFVAGTLLNNYTIGLVPVVYGTFSFFTTWGMGYLAKRYF